MTVPYTFANQNGPIPLSQLDANFSSVGSANNVTYTAPFSNSQTETVTNKLSQTVSVVDFGADPTGNVDSTAAFNNALAASNSVYVPEGTYIINSTITIPGGTILFGASIYYTLVTITTNNTAFVLSGYSQLRQMRITKSGTHTTSLVNIGDASSNEASRSVVSDLFITGAGTDGLQVRYGNLGTIENITSQSNGRDGINFTNEKSDTNAWTMQGFIDVISNTRDGIHLEPAGGSGIGSLSNQFFGIVAQNNGRYGVYVGTRSNIMSMYCEASGTSDIYLDTGAIGNFINPTNGIAVDNSSDKTSNIIFNPDAGANYWRIFQNRTRFSGKSTAGFMLSDDDGTAGELVFSKLGAYSYGITSGSATQETLTFQNSAYPSGGANLSLIVGGFIYPTVDNTYSVGISSRRWSVIYAATGTINTSDANQKQQFASLTEAEQATAKAIKGLFKTFKFNDAVAKKGDKARIHIGVSAQDVQQAFTSNGLDATKYGLFCSDTWKDEKGIEQTQLGVRYEELLAFVISAM